MESCSTLAECWVMKDANNLLQSGAAAAAAQQNSNLLERRTSPALWFSVSKVSSCCCPKTFAPKSGLPLLTLVTHISPAFDLFGAAFPALLANSGAASFESNLSRNAKLFRCKWHVQISLFDDAKIMIVIAKLSICSCKPHHSKSDPHLGIFTAVEAVYRRKLSIFFSFSFFFFFQKILPSSAPTEPILLKFWLWVPYDKWWTFP